MTEFPLMDAWFLWTCLWQVTVFLALGGLVAWRLRNRPSQAHFVLLLALLAAVIAPAASLGVRVGGWGLLPDATPQASVDGALEPATPTAKEMDREGFASQASSGGVWAALIGWTWIVISGLLLLQLGLRYLAGRRVLARARPLVNEEIQRTLEAVVARVKKGALPIVFTSENVRCPSI